MTCGEALDWLHGTQLFGIKLGLENIRRLAAALGADRPTARIIHVAGTNGKGSVCAMAEAMARAAGWRTGLFTSPHLVRYNERIQINGLPVSDDLIAAGLSRIREIVADWDPHPTYFEITTALALRIFQDAAVEVLILETGMGGRLDSTNFLTPTVSVLTKIDFDHAQWLGPTLRDIATEKAGIIKENIPVITFANAANADDRRPLQHPEVLDVIRQTAARKNAPLITIAEPLENLAMSLAGSHQRWNAALATRALEIAGIRYDPAALAHHSWPGRFQNLGGLILDGAHNPAAAARLVQTWREVFGPINPTIILGLLGDKDIAAIIREFLPLAAHFIAVPVRNPRSLPAETLAGHLREAGATEVQSAASLDAALAVAARPLLITGSLFLVGEALSILEQTPRPRESSQ